jgi:Uma2 family endonuclease
MQHDRKSAGAYDCTYEDLVGTPEDGRRYEVLDGELVVTPAPLPRHQRNTGNLFRIVDRHVQASDLGVLYFAPVDVILDTTNVVQPDLVFIERVRHRDVKPDQPIRLVPDLVVEIVSRGTKKRDRVTKRELYEHFGVPHYWMLDPSEKVMEENVLRRKKYVRRSVVSGDGVVEPAAFPGLEIPLGQVWKV